MLILQTLRTYDENSRIFCRRGRHVSAKQCAKTNPARDLKNGIKIDRFPLMFSTLQLNNLQKRQVGNSGDSAIKQSKVLQTRKAIFHDRGKLVIPKKEERDSECSGLDLVRFLSSNKE